MRRTFFSPSAPRTQERQEYNKKCYYYLSVKALAFLRLMKIYSCSGKRRWDSRQGRQGRKGAKTTVN